MADARSLLRSRRQDARISHPLASYTTAGQLRCIACAITIKNTAAWDGHIGSKAHRLAASELRKREQRNADSTRLASIEKRTISQVDDVEANSEEERIELAPKRTRTEKHAETHEASSSTLPPNFFSNPSLAPVISSASDTDDDESELPLPPSLEKQATANSQLDLELQQFQASLASINPISQENSEYAGREAYDRATVFAEPEIHTNTDKGFPSDEPSKNVDAPQNSSEKLETEDNRQLRQEQEERELIMDRLIEEVLYLFHWFFKLLTDIGLKGTSTRGS